MKSVIFPSEQTRSFAAGLVALCSWWSCLLVQQLLGQQLGAQNLVPNPNFDAYDLCPPYLGQIHTARFWDSPNFATSDYFHACSDSANGNGVPGNRFGRQLPVAGDGYAGIRLWFAPGIATPNQREYLTVRLLEPLQADSLYQVSFFANLSDLATRSTDALGLGFSDQPFPGTRLIPFKPAVRLPSGSFLQDRVYWTQVSGAYRAQGGEEYLIIGNFLPDDSLTLVELDPGAVAEPLLAAYVYIDSVSVAPAVDCPELDLLPPDTSLCAGETLALVSPLASAQHRWSTGDTLPTLRVQEGGTYVLRAQQGPCQWQDSLRLSLILPPSPLGEVDTILCEESSWLFTPRADALGIAWQDGWPSAERRLASEGLYELTLFYPCDTLFQSIRLQKEACHCELGEAQNVVTPNGDGINDVFRLNVPEGMELHQLSVYDRWGKAVFQTQGPDAWRGTSGGRPLPEGVYFWQLEANCREAGRMRRLVKRGPLTLLR